MTTTNAVTDAEIAAAGHDLEDAPKVRALCEFIECTPGELSLERHDLYGLPVYSYGQLEYAVGTDSEADDAVEQNIRDSIWAFNAQFILEQCDLPRELDKAIGTFQSEECEGANEALLKLVEKCCGLADFTKAAVSADGRGHFLSGYDGEENESGEFYIYRVN